MLATFFRSYEAEPYVPQFYTADESEEVEGDGNETEEEVSVPEGAIWDLSSRWDKNKLSSAFHVVHLILQVKQEQSKAGDRDST